jgi:predicted nuclease of predicted toxin-antitoxin system
MISFYMDQHIPRAITEGLRLRGVDVVTAYEDGASRMEDAELMDRATEIRRVLFTQDDDLLAEAALTQLRQFSEIIGENRWLLWEQSL